MSTTLQKIHNIKCSKLPESSIHNACLLEKKNILQYQRTFNIANICA